MQITLDDAKTLLPNLVDTARSGEEVIITDGGHAVARLVSVTKSGFKVGILKGQLAGPGPDFFGPMSEENLELWEGGSADKT